MFKVETCFFAFVVAVGLFMTRYLEIASGIVLAFLVLRAVKAREWGLAVWIALMTDALGALFVLYINYNYIKVGYFGGRDHAVMLEYGNNVFRPIVRAWLAQINIFVDYNPSAWWFLAFLSLIVIIVFYLMNRLRRSVLHAKEKKVIGYRWKYFIGIGGIFALFPFINAYLMGYGSDFDPRFMVPSTFHFLLG